MHQRRGCLSFDFIEKSMLKVLLKGASMRFFSFIFILTAALIANAGMKTEWIDYKDGATVMRGYLAYDDANKAPRPGVLIVHDWMGMGANPKMRAEKVAALGYVAFAADIYGVDHIPKNQDEASKTAGEFKNDRKLLRKRASLAMDVLKKQKNVDIKKLSVMGYCFGGTTALELARSGAPIKGVISFHGGLATPNPEDAKNIKGKVLALHGGDDPFVKHDEVDAFQKEMRDAKIDWQFVSYGGAVHSFTIAEAGSDNSKGAAYNKQADERSWEAMKNFFNEIFM